MNIKYHLLQIAIALYIVISAFPVYSQNTNDSIPFDSLKNETMDEILTQVRNGDTIHSELTATHWIETVTQIHGKGSEECLKNALEIAMIYMNAHNFTKAKEWLENWFPECERLNYNTDSILESLALLEAASSESEQNQELRRVSLTKALEYLSKIKDAADRDVSKYRIKIYDLIGTSYLDEAQSLATEFNFKESLEKIRKAKQVFMLHLGRESYSYLLALIRETKVMRESGLDEESIRIHLEILGLLSAMNGEDSSEYIGELSKLSIAYIQVSEYKKAIECSLSAIEKSKKINGEKSDQYSDLLTILGWAYNNAGDYEKAMNVIEEATDIIKISHGERSRKYAGQLRVCAACKFLQGNPDAAVKLYENAIGIFEALPSENIDDKNECIAEYTKALGELAKAYASIGRQTEALRTMDKALTRYDDAEYKNPREFLSFILSASQLYQSLGNYQEAWDLMNYLEKNALAIYGSASKDYYEIMNGKCSLTSEMIHQGIDLADYDITEATLVNQAFDLVDLARDLFGDDSDKVIMQMNNVAVYLDQMGNHEQALSLYDKIYELSKKNSKVKGKHQYLLNYALIQDNNKNYESAYALARECLDEYKERSVQRSSIIRDITGAVLQTAHNLHDISGKPLDPDMPAIVTDYFSASVNMIKATLCNLSSDERSMYWRNIAPKLNKIHYYSAVDNNPLITECGYNAALLSKGLLLNSEIDLHSFIRETNDSISLSLYDEIRLLRNKIKKCRDISSDQHIGNLDSLEQAADKKERELINRSKIYGDYTRNLFIDWKTIQKHLSSDEVAIEFASWECQGDTVQYLAYIIDDKMNSPVMIPLSTNHDIGSIKARDLYTTEKLYNLIWKPLERYLIDKNKIYFAPTGDLYNIAIEYLPGQVTSETERIYRLSSTKEIAIKKDRIWNYNAVLFGGLHYRSISLSGDSDTKGNQKFSTPQRSNASRSVVKQPKYLPGTLTEVQNIDSLFKKANFSSTVYADSLGSEYRFKELSGQKTAIIHIATHGFLNSEKAHQGKEDLFSSLEGVAMSNIRYIEDYSMSRSGLLLSGATKALQGDSLKNEGEDGILTAQEISMMDLRGLDLVVLSACQTGLGDITGDGVFGLQRGFKKAGAKSILMSLWKVDDQATEILMSTFYENLLSGIDKTASLRKAQDAVKEHSIILPDGSIIHPYSKPRFWASFILLDAI